MTYFLCVCVCLQVSMPSVHRCLRRRGEGTEPRELTLQCRLSPLHWAITPVSECKKEIDRCVKYLFLKKTTKNHHFF